MHFRGYLLLWILKKRKLIMNEFITSQFVTVHLCGCFIAEKWTITSTEFMKGPWQLLDIDKSVTVHHSNIRKLAVAIFKIKYNLSPEILNDIIEIVYSSYNLRKDTIFKKRNVRTVRYGTETISFPAPKIWEIVLTESKTSCSIQEFKCKIKQCTCRLCKSYINQVNFL